MSWLKAGTLNHLQKTLQQWLVSKLRWAAGMLPSAKIGPRALPAGIFFLVNLNDSKKIKRLTLPTKSEGRLVVYCHLPVGKDC